MADSAQPPLRVAIFSRYNLAEQYDLAAEFESMLNELARHDSVLHLSLRGPHEPQRVPPHVTLEYLPARVDRASPRDILLKTALLYFLLPIAAWKIRRFKPDVIFMSEIIPLFALFLQAASGVPVATAYGDWHLHNIFGRRWWSRPILRLAEWLERFEMRHLRGAFCRAAAAGIRLQAWGLPEHRIRVVHDAPDPKAFFPADESDLRRSLGFTPEDVVLLYHGVMHQGKGLDRLLTWTADLMKSQPNLRLVLVGGGPEEASLRALAQSLGIADRTVFTGWLRTIVDVGRYCNAADICIAMRTKSEANDKIVPGALLHSMACRKVVIGPRLRGVQEILRHGENGYLFEPDDGDSFRQLILDLIAHRGDWARVADAAHADIQANYSVPAAGRKYAEAIEHFATLQRTATLPS